MSNTNCSNVSSCRSCDSCYSCYSCRSCDSCYSCDSCRSCIAVLRGLFCYKQEAKKNIIFRTEVSEDRFWEVLKKYRELLGGWQPRQTNGFELYKKNGNKWEGIDMTSFQTIGWYDSWKSMPKEAIEYIVSLPEFVEEDFKAITGLEVKDSTDEKTEEAIALLKEHGYKIVKG